jgi:hypothetical protein
MAKTKPPTRQRTSSIVKDSSARSPRAKRKKRAASRKTSTEVEPARGSKRRKRTVKPRVRNHGVNEVLRNALFEDLALAEDEARTSTISALTDAEIPGWVDDPEAIAVLRSSLRSQRHVVALSAFVQEMVHSALHSALVSIDGGSASAEVGRIRMVDESGDSLGEGLHELYVDYLFETSRMS